MSEVQIHRTDVLPCPDVRAPPLKVRRREATRKITEIKVTREPVAATTTTATCNATHGLLTADEIIMKEQQDPYTYKRRGAAPIAAASVIS